MTALLTITDALQFVHIFVEYTDASTIGFEVVVSSVADDRKVMQLQYNLNCAASFTIASAGRFRESLPTASTAIEL